ncbi:MAG: FHIPEP family type III secretion protein, partial [Planctomycetota bacterium]
MMNSTIQANRTDPVLFRPEAVFIAAAVTLLVGLLLGVHENLLDILWVCAFCLAGAAIIICVAAKSSVDLIGFVPIVSVLTLLRIALGAATARKIVAHDTTGTLVSSLGKILTASWPLGAVLTGLVLAAVLVIILFAACQRMALASNNYLGQILPLKRIGVATDLRMGVINEADATMLDSRITSEYRFFSGMNGVSLLMRGEAAISIFILLTCLVTLASSNSFESISQEGLLGPVMAFGVFSLVPAVIVAVSCGGLMSKETLALRPEQGDQEPVKTKKVTLINQETGDAEEVELLNPDFMDYAGVDDRIVEFEPPRKAEAVAALSAAPPQPEAADETTRFPSCSSPGEYYKKLGELISAIESRPRVAVLASEDIHSLPVTVAVNIAIGLAQQKQTVLMVDTDTTRNALAQVFELDPALMQKKIQSSCLENLSACSIPVDKIDLLLKKKKITERFDTLLIYAPEADMVRLTEKAGSSREVLFFGDAAAAQSGR